MPKYIIRRQYRNTLEAGEVVVENPKTYTTKPIEVDGVLQSHMSGRVPKEEVVFVTEDVNKVVRLMAVYKIAGRQHQAVIEAADAAFLHVVDILATKQDDALKPREERSSSQM